MRIVDPGTFLEVARLSRTTDFGQEMDLWTYFSDFRDVQGIVNPHRIEMEYGTRHVVREVDVPSAPEEPFWRDAGDQEARRPISRVLGSGQ